MEELTSALDGFAVSRTLNDPSAPHPRYAQYKKKNVPDQNERRKRILETQKQRRFDAQAHIRALCEDQWEGLPYGRKKDEIVNEDMETECVIPKKPGRYYRDQLMLSEWMVDVPENLLTDWLWVACPVGKRCLVIAGSGYTSAYSKSGMYMFHSFQSTLPGGCRKYAGRSDSTILDCIYNDSSRTFHILDMMCWNDMEVYNTEMEFRIFWLNSKISEMEDDINVLKKNNEFKFVRLPFHTCDRDTITTVLHEHKPEQLDGLLFCHKRVHYLFGANPLCLWLQAYMLMDVLGIETPEAHMRLAPQSYQGFQHHIEMVKKKKAKNEEKNRKKQERRRSGGDACQRVVANDNVMESSGTDVIVDKDGFAVDAQALLAVLTPLQPKVGKNKKKKRKSCETMEVEKLANT